MTDLQLGPLRRYSNRLRDRYEHRRRLVLTRVRRSRCASCGLLGGYTDRHNTPSLATLQEIPSSVRDEWLGRLRLARRTGKLGRTEYDWRHYHDLGLSTEPLGVACGIRDRRGARSTLEVPGPRQTTGDFVRMDHLGALVTRPDPTSRSILGEVVGYVQTFVWELVRPHDCPHHVKHRPGLTPAEMHRHRLTRWSRRRREIASGILLLAALATIANFIARIGG